VAILSRKNAAEIMGPDGPQLSAARLHPWVWEHATQLWADGHRRAAVEAAATALFDSHIPAKLGRQRDTKAERTSWVRLSQTERQSRACRDCAS
jgi:hypothetical protein